MIFAFVHVERMKMWCTGVFVFVLLSRGLVAARTICPIRTNGWQKDYTFNYKGEKAAAFDNYEIRPLPTHDTESLKEISNVGSVEECFKECVDLKSQPTCQSFTYESTGTCILWHLFSVVADGSDGKHIAQFCRNKTSVAGYLGYSSNESAEDKAEKKNCGDEDYKSALDRCSKLDLDCPSSWSPVCLSTTGFKCICPK